MTTSTLYTGILTHNQGISATTVVSGYDYDQVVETTKQHYVQFIQSIHSLPIHEWDYDGNNTTHWCVITTEVPTPPKEAEPQWFTDLKSLLSPYDMASRVTDRLQDWKGELIHCLCEEYEDPIRYFDALTQGWVFQGLNPHSLESLEFLQGLADLAQRDVSEYEANETLVLLDYLNQ